MNYVIHILVYLCIYAIAALGLNFIVGCCGRLSLAQASLFAVGAYAYAVARVAYGVGFLPALISAAVSGAIASLPLALLAWRYRGDIFVLVSIAFQTLLYSLLSNSFSMDRPLGSLANLTNGPFGILGIPGPSPSGMDPHSPASLFMIAAPALFAITILCAAALHSPWARALRAIRDDELAARGIGKDLRRLLTESFAFCGILAGLAGGLYASYVGFIDPSVATLEQCVAMLSMLIIGGMGNISGPLVGVAIYLVIPEILRALPIGTSAAANGRAIIFGVLLILVIQIRPEGAAGERCLR